MTKKTKISLFKKLKLWITFDKKYYLNKYPDVKKANVDPFWHYINHGIYEKRHPNKKSYEKKLIKDKIFTNKEIYIDINKEKTKIQKNKNPRIAVHLHLYYIHLLDEMIHYIKNIPFSFDIFISITKTDELDFVNKKIKEELSNANSVNIKIVKNVGRDIYPFVNTFAEEILSYDIFCHIHTKQSLSSTSFTKLFFWRKYLLEALLGNENVIIKIISILTKEDSGLVFPEPYYNLSYSNISIKWWNRFPSVHYLLKKIDVSLPNSDFMFPAGTMFWCKTRAINRILKARLSADDFPKEMGVLNDGSTAHALERLIGLVSLQNGFKNYIIKSPQDNVLKSKNLFEAQKKFLTNLFSTKWYSSAYPDVIDAGLDPYFHYLNYGFLEGRIPYDYCPQKIINKIKRQLSKPLYKYIDYDYYLKTYAEVLNAYLFGGILPEEHYINIGSKAGFIPNDISRRAIISSKSINNFSFAIIIPVYKSEKFLRHCLDSVYNQTVKNLHVIIVNDGSPDESQKIINEYKNKYSLITDVIVNEQNLGLVNSHRKAIEMVNEDYFTILDGDDWLELNFCEELFYISKTYNVDCVCCSWTRPKLYTPPKNVQQLPIDLRILSGKFLIDAIGKWSSYPNIHYGLNRKLYLTESWKQYIDYYPNENILFSEDVELTTNFATKCKKVACIRNFYYHWFDNPDSASNCILTEKYVDNNFAVINDLYYLKTCTIKELNDLYNRNIENCIMTEFKSRLIKLMQVPNNNAKSIIELFAKYYDNNLDKFNEIQKYDIETFLMSNYYKLITVKPIVEDYVLLLDPIGIKNIKKYFLEYFIANCNFKTKYIELSNFDQLSKRLNNMQIGCCAKAVITTGGWAIKDFHTNRPIIQLWHGLGAIKRVSPFPMALKPIVGFCSSKYIIDVYASLYGVERNKVKSLGSIVTDDILDKSLREKAKESFYKKFPELVDKKLYLWCPTFRGSGANIHLNQIPNLEEISHLLKKDEILLCKFHPSIVDISTISSKLSNISNIIDVTKQDLFELLSVTSVFMTDYSSTLHYAMLMKIPVAFLLNDYDNYSVDQGLLIDIKDFCGPVLTNFNSKEILNILRNPELPSSAKYKKFLMFHCEACVEGNCKRKIFEEIIMNIKSIINI